MTIEQQPTPEKETIEPHNEHQVQESILSFLNEHPGCHTVRDVHFGISDYFADHLYEDEVSRILWKLYEDGMIKYAGGQLFSKQSTPLTPMTDKHPITPPVTLVAEWASESLSTQRLCTRAARWGADQELEACCKVVNNATVVPLESGVWLRNARRPKPLSLKEQALSELAAAVAAGDITPERGATIRLALETLPDGPSNYRNT